jgi:HEPN domain-containing protein
MADEAVYEWLDRARADLRVATEILRPDDDFIAVVLFLAQQAAEKSMKGLLVLRGIRFPRTHSLNELGNLLPDPELADLIGEVAEYSDYATVFRYPGADEDVPSIDEARHALAMVSQLYAAILERIPEELRPVKHA